MQESILSLGLAFLEGFALIISPCILPILPIILAGSLTGSRKRAFGIIIGFILIFSMFTFFSRALVQYSGIDLGLIRHISYALLLLLGIVMLSSYLTEIFTNFTQRLSNVGSNFSLANNAESNIWGGILFGGLVAIIWTPCAGPILATVILQTVLQKTNLLGFFSILAFGIGAGVPMLLIALFGRSLTTKFSFLKVHAGFFRKVLGAIIILSVGYTIYVEKFGLQLSDASPTQFTQTNNLQKGLESPYPAPAIAGIEAWINSPPLNLQQLRGKVILIDFWTYSCINCIRTLPYIKSWYAKYHDQGLEIIGIHSPEFDFEKNYANVKSFVMQNKILYPVALDNLFVTWQSFKNHYWPAHYLINKEGNVVYQHFGEGEYGVTENNIRFLLGLNKLAEQQNQTPVSSRASSQTPETYLGYSRATTFATPEALHKDTVWNYKYPSTLPENHWALQGAWEITPDKIIARENNALLKIKLSASKVFIVMGASAPNKEITVQASLQTITPGDARNKEIFHTSLIVNKNKLYEVIDLNSVTNGILEIQAQDAGLEIYTFTFGS